MKKLNEADFLERLAEFYKERIRDNRSAHALAEQILRGAQEGLEINCVTFDEWFESRLKYQSVWLDKDDYSRALIRALRLAPGFAGTDFGSSRQRDMAQVWTDTARGFLGEISVSKFLLGRFGIEIYLDTRRGEPTEFLPTDIVKIKLPHNSNLREPRLKISIKTTKFNGRWLDAPGAQINHSDVFILVKIGILRHHFLAFLKAISFLKEKLLAQAKALGELDDNTAEELWNEIPHFDPIPAYVAGYLNKSELNLPIHQLVCRKRGRAKTPRIVVTQGIGVFSEETLRNHPYIKSLDPGGNLKIGIEPIIDSIKSSHFLAHSGGLKWGEKEWDRLIKNL
jgi:hypothetical protein